MIIISIREEQYSYIFIYILILMAFIIPNEILERILKKNAQRRIISGLIEKKVEIEKIQSKHLSTISKATKKMKFWAKNGYILFIILLGLTIFSFSLYFLHYIFFIIGLIFGISTAIFGFLLLRFLSRS